MTAATDAADLALGGLQEIALPAPVPYVPATAAWLVLALLLTGLTAYAGWRRYRRHVANRYRRVARAELAAIAHRLSEPAERRAALSAVPALVKRTALAFAPRAQVAGLTDGEWLAFLDRTYAPGGFTRGPGRLLPRLAYAPDGELAHLAEADLSALVGLIGQWIDRHDARL